jgi:hypothetical protein
MTPCFINSPLSSLPPSVSSSALCLPSTAICSLYELLFSLRASILSMVPVQTTDFCTLTAFCLFCGPLSFLQPSVSSTAICTPLNPYVPTTGLVPLYDTMYPLWSYVPSKAICPLYGSMSPLQPSATYTALCHLYGPLPPIRPSATYTALCHLYGPLPPIRPSATYTALCLLFGPLPLLQPSVLSTNLCLLYSSFPLYDHLSPLRTSVLSMVPSKKSETTCLVS